MLTIFSTVDTELGGATPGGGATKSSRSIAAQRAPGGGRGALPEGLVPGQGQHRLKIILGLLQGLRAVVVQQEASQQKVAITRGERGQLPAPL